MDEYLAGERTAFEVPIASPGTEFQRDVWDALQTIPFGETRSYGDIAAAIGRPTAVRAVGKANGDNRLAVIIPCHRVVGADGKLTGYGGGMWRKQRLLELESR
jgi:AraC family transcriptional regulator of adaptative response/methylated-DNA-[protein]-cysteine methyltransferase